MKRLLTTVALLALLVPTLGHAQVTNVTQATSHTTINDALTTVASGDLIQLDPVTFAETFEISVDGITIQGAGPGLTTIDVGGLAGSNSSGIHVVANNVTLSGFTVLGARSTSNLPRYGIKTNDVSGGVLADLEIESIYRSGLDILGSDGLQVTDVYSHDNGGTGMQTTDGNNHTFQNITTADNAWGGLGIFTWGRYSPIGVSGIVFSGSNSFGEPIPLYLEEGNYNDPLNPELITFSSDPLDGADVTVQLSDVTHFLTGDSDNDNVYTIFFLDLVTAQSAAAYPGVFGHISTNRYIDMLAGTHLYVESAVDGTLGQLGGVQAAVDAADSGDVVNIGAGTFTEQVELAKDITLSGAGAAQTTIQSPTTLPLSFTTGTNDNFPVVYVHDADAVVENLTVDGANEGDTNYRFIGIGFWNAGGSVSSCDVLNIMNSSFSGAQHGVGVYAYNDTGGPYQIALIDVQVLDYQKTAVALSGDGLTVDLDGVTCIGQGDTGVTAQNGIQISYGAAGSVANCVVNDNSWNGGTWTASGMLLYLSGAVDVSNSNLTGNQTSIYGQEMPSMDVDNCAIDVSGAPTVSSGVLGYLPAPPKEGGGPRLPGQPLAEDYVPNAARKAAVMTVVVTNSTITGSGAPDTWGIDCGSYDGLMEVTATGNTVSNWDYGVDLWGTNVTAAVNDNNLTGNVSAGLRSSLANPVDGTCNWYGDISGPATTTNPGAGDAVEGDVAYSPWRDGAVPGSSCSQFEGTVAANPTGEISACNSCLVVPIEFDRFNTVDLRGLSVTFQLSPELELCSGVADIQEATGVGSLFDDVVGANTQFLVIDNGGGSYTADVSLLGLPCGTATGGTTILVGVTSAAGITTDTTGTITVTGVTARDCDNNPLPGAPGAPATVTINNGAPGVVSDLSAVQDKSGNGSDGTTEINLTWTDPTDPDLATIEIYRKGFGNYPEYDDLGGAVPPAPADATAAAADWTFVASVAAGAGSYTDEPGSRDFWYYVVYANDGCNDGAISNRTGGTLNYHLGDIVPGGGNNIVGTGDVSALGTAYGTVDGDANYNDLADVGPTTDNFVNARPTTDDQIQFEDLLMFAINYGQVSKRPDGLASAGRSDLQLMVPSLPAAGEIFEVSLVMAGDGTVHGVSTDVTWNDARVEYLGFAPGELMNRQGTYAPVFSPKVGRLDAAVFGTERGILGEGTLATLRFKVRESGDAGFEIASIDARNGDNEEASIGSSVVSGVPGAGTTAKVTQLLPNIPNPFNPATEIRFVVGQKGPVSVQIYSLQGRLVRTLVQEPMDAGAASLTWHGRDDSGRTVASGTYVVRIDGPDRTHTRNIVLLK